MWKVEMHPFQAIWGVFDLQLRIKHKSVLQSCNLFFFFFENEAEYLADLEKTK